MGLFSKIRDLFKKEKTPLLDAGKEYQQNNNNGNYLKNPIYLKDANGNNTIILNSIKYDNQFVYQDGTKTNIMVAQILKQTNIGEESHGLFRGDREYIAFEMSDGMAVNNEILMQKIATYYSYEQQHNMFQNEECKFIGYIDSNPGNYQININPNIEKYVKDNLSEKIKNEANIENAIRQEEIIKNHKEDISASKKYRNNLYQETRRYMEENKKQKNDRIQNFYLNQKFVQKSQNGKTYAALEGIDVTNGDYLHVSELNKVGKDETGTYVYTAYLEDSAEKNYVQNLGNGMVRHSNKAVPVCFTTQKRIEDILAGQNRQEIYNVLSLFSNKEVAKNNNGYLNFIGSLDENANIKQSNQNELTSTIKQTISKLQEQFYQKTMQERNGQGHNNVK